jgi:NADH:ubiquinone oxidoreductase subunit 4 (subunit M)
MVIILIVRRDVVLLFIVWPFIIFPFCFILFDFILKKLLKKNIRRMLLIEGVISLMLLIASFYLQFKKSRHDPQNIHVEPVKVSE